jgi:diacylglycerol kinase family enzyme
MIPSGSGNGLARELRVPLNPASAITAALNAAPRAIDAGELGGRPFFNMAGVGFDARIASRFDRAGRRGFATYVRVSARELVTYRSATYRIRVGEPDSVAVHDRGDTAGGAPQPAAAAAENRGSAANRRALLVTLANSPQFGNGAVIAPLARVDDGWLDLVVYEERSRWATVWAVPRLFSGSVSAVRGLSVQRVEHATIESDTPMTYHVDGEPVEGGTKLEARVLPSALLVCS